MVARTVYEVNDSQKRCYLKVVVEQFLRDQESQRLF